ncbi:helix-turn-helix domain-containing protein [Canibacter zhoujuaniae]|uniref:helix-turn-helix domain-containing protein n=1 Tax=Canibacter zhoujuaniae TaxID=2708343 RepID=UPI0014233F3C|nr:helix-turn-helix domain-containing protein [Canibacter zhoujuaniae]
MKDVQEHMGVTRETITQWINNKNMPAYKVGHSWKFKLSEVDDWGRSNGAADEKYSSEN